MSMTRRGPRRATAAVGLALVAVAAGGCGEELGPGTACSKFITLSAGDQETAIKALLESKGQSQGTGSVMIARGSAQAFCRTIGAGKTIEGIYGG